MILTVFQNEGLLFFTLNLYRKDFDDEKQEENYLLFEGIRKTEYESK